MKTPIAAFAAALVSLSPALAGSDHVGYADTGHPLIGEPPTLAVTPAPDAKIAAATPSAEEMRLTSLLGLPVYDADENALGDVADLVLTADGAVETIIIRVGGIFGVGWKDVSMPIDEMEKTTGPDGEIRVIVKTAP